MVRLCEQDLIQRYKENRRNSRRQYKRLEVSAFIGYVEENFAEGWSLDVCVGKALESGKFRRDQIVCTKTLLGEVNVKMSPAP